MDIPGEIRIVCVGDSHTFGVGTGMSYTYPAQLERLLTLNNHEQKFSVINLGIPGASTKRQAQELKSFFNKHEAKIIILLTGRNNDFELKEGQDASFFNSIKYRLENLRSFKFLKVIFDRIVRRNKQRDSQDMLAYKERYVDYLSYQLEWIRKLCRDKGAKLILLSYYNTSDNVIKEFAHKYNIPYLDFTGDFQSLFKREGRSRYISPDASHLNYLG
ncbi:MAG: SGNH/GDSL hydrolase family protein, partial [Candidatus Omnitrophica bacterium]|nr:SGNH/GDSL hydrolase family protein [Candidatus Omnitrophota bacterium]